MSKRVTIPDSKRQIVWAALTKEAGEFDRHYGFHLRCGRDPLEVSELLDIRDYLNDLAHRIYDIREDYPSTGEQ